MNKTLQKYLKPIDDKKTEYEIDFNKFILDQFGEGKLNEIKNEMRTLTQGEREDFLNRLLKILNDDATLLNR